MCKFYFRFCNKHCCFAIYLLIIGVCFVEIVKSVSERCGNTVDGNDEDSEDDSQEIPVPSFKEFRHSLDIVQRYLESLPGTEKHLADLDAIDNDIATRVFTQKRITDFWK